MDVIGHMDNAPLTSGQGHDVTLMQALQGMHTKHGSGVPSSIRGVVLSVLRAS